MYSEYFDEKELSCPCCGTMPENGIDDKIISFLDNLQYYCDEKIEIESCYRCEDYNHHINGYKNSYHTKGKAVNLFIPYQYTQDEFIDICNELGAEHIYNTAKKDVIHIDCI